VALAAVNEDAMNDSRAMLDNLEMLTMLPPDVRSLVANSFVPASFPFGSTIVREGDDGDAFFVIASGRARTVKQRPNGDEVSLAVLRAGDIFGEMALLGGGKRTATVRASTDVEAFSLSKPLFDALLRQYPQLRTHLEVPGKRRRLSEFLRLYAPFADLPSEALQIMLADFDPVSSAKGELVIRQGEASGPMFLIEEGRLRVFRGENGDRQDLGFLRKGDFFGEMSVLTGERRGASVEALSDCVLLRLNTPTVERLLEEFPAFRVKLDERVAQYQATATARIPLDFADEILPADALAQEKVGPGQVDGDTADAELAFGPFASREGHFVKRNGRIRRFPYVQQSDEADCGAACLAMVCRHFGRAVSLTRVRRAVGTASDGTSLKGICRGAQELGLASRSVKVSPNNFAKMPLPAIVHWEGNHWVVLYHTDRKHVWVANPSSGLSRMERAEFEVKWTGYASLFDYTADFEKTPTGRAGASWIRPLVRPFMGTLVKCVALALIVSALQMMMPVFTQVVVDRVLVDRDVGMLGVVVAGMAILLTFSLLAALVQGYLLSFVAVWLDTASLDLLTRRLLALPMSYFATRRTGDIHRRLQGLRKLREFVVQHGVAALTSSAQLIVAVTLMFVYDARLALVFLAAVPFYGLLMRVAKKRLRPLHGELEDACAKVGSNQIDAIKGIETVKAMAAESALRDAMLVEYHGIGKAQFRASFLMMCYDGAVRFLTFATLTLFLWEGAHRVMDGALTIGGLVAFNSLVALANQPILVLLTLWDLLQTNAVLLDRVNDIFEQEPEQGADRSGLRPVKSLEGRVRLQNVGFRYGGPESPRILKDISFDVPAGKMVAIVGRSGSGKTTLVRLLTGLNEPTDGTITFDGVDSKKLDYRQLRRHIGFVLQENHLFNETIAGNIAFGDDEPDLDRVLWASRVASAHEFVDRLPLGYETKVGESGLALSGGQRQRIAIARAVYRKPPVLIFDEATSALDSESEKAVQGNLGKLLAGRTSFVIAHRLSTIRAADVILVLEKGELVESGNHEELMQRKGLYHYLCSQQLGFE
jgi:HlyB family type I secretion system ABC transporter